MIRKLEAEIERVTEKWPRYGYRRITVELNREGVTLNSKRVRRVMHEMGLCGLRKGNRRCTTHSNHAFPRYPNLVRNLEIVRPDQVWVAD